MTLYAYGMRLRGFSPGCQPMSGLVRCMDSEDKNPFGLPKDTTMFSCIATSSRRRNAATMSWTFSALSCF